VTGNIIDRRKNPKDRNLVNRRRFIDRARDSIRRSTRDTLGQKGLKDTGDSKINVDGGGIGEPRFAHDGKSGERDMILPGNKTFSAGDKIAKPPSGGGGAQGTKPGDGEGFEFTISHDEMMDLVFEDLELPDLVKESEKSTILKHPQRAGYSTSGPPSGLDVRRTISKSLSRRIALKLPKLNRVKELQDELEETEDEASRAEIEAEIIRLRALAEGVAFLDPVDLRYRRFEQVNKPSARALMLCLMDVSSSMGDRERRIAKQFYHLLALFLRRRYREFEIVFIRHHHAAEECDEETFFGTGSGGSTVVSSAYEVTEKVLRERYPPDDWNIYIAQVSDGDNSHGDHGTCLTILNRLIPICQYFAYVEVGRVSYGWTTEVTTVLWRTLEQIKHEKVALRLVDNDEDVVPAFRSLFDGSGGKTFKP
jgi:uncharacterized sporulation protein YeaH/YhbH (DUF444 family)